MTGGNKTAQWKVLLDKVPESCDEVLKAIAANRNILDMSIFASDAYTEPTPADVGIDEKQFAVAVERIKKALKDSEQIVIFGDYDADGICAATILWESLYEHSKKVMPYIPHRVEEGYGISKDSIDNLLEKYPDTKLIITVDNGIVAHDAVKYAQKKGVDTIITDHHTKGETYPDAHAIVYTNELAGAGVAWMLAKEFSQESTNHLELVAIAAVADLVPLTGWNRKLVKKGLEILNQTKRLGLKQILTEAKITGRKLGVFDIGYIIAPRLNAAGRMDHAIESLRLLCTKSFDHARLKAAIIAGHNRQRQHLTENLTTLAKNIFDKTPHHKIAVLAHNKFEEGVVGLIASKIVEEYYVPAIVMSITGDTVKGSARSVNGVNITELLKTQSHLLEGVGGHPMAAGFHLKKDNLDLFVTALQQAAEKSITDAHLTKIYKADSFLPLSLATEELVDRINMLYPFGIGNPEPCFVIQNLTVASLQKVGKQKNHLKLILSDKTHQIEAIAFGFGSTGIKRGESVDTLTSVSVNEWNNKKTLTLKIKDIKKTAT